jgi:hypothetical protein
MLWYKGWLETRLKLIPASLMTFFFLYTVRTTPEPGGNLHLLGGILMMDNIAVGMACVFLAGAGIMTQPAFQQTKGIHGSTLFTLSLPVSRVRLLAVRASLGWLLLAGVIAVMCGAVWTEFPELRTISTTAEMCEYAGILLAGASVYYCLFVLLATFLEETWRVFAGMFGFWGWRWISKHTTLPVFTDVYRMTGDGSPLKAHTMPWSALAFSLTLSAVLLLMALKIVRVREY